MKLGALLQQHGYQFERDERLGVYLTNALESLPSGQQTLPFAQFIAEEGRQADAVKQQQPVMVVLGNPPYSGHSENKGEWIGKLVRDYYFVDGKPLGERNPKWLQDDYVKFLRFGQWRISHTGEGVLAFISNNGYLDNPTFRGMRQCLLHEFDTIYLLNLHGNSKKKERTPQGEPDENVFDIQQGVAIGIFIKQGEHPQQQAAVYYADLWGDREGKYESLLAQEMSSTQWQQLAPSTPWYLFIPQNIDLSEEYLQGWKITDIMPVNSAGIVTARDHLTIQWSRKQLLQITRDFASLSTEEAREKYLLGDDVRDWKVALAQGDIHSEPINDDKVIPLFYRPFDQRYTYYTGQTRGFLCMPRSSTVYHLLNGDNISISFARSTSPGRPFDHIFCMRHTILARFFTDSACTTYFAPLYLYPNGSEHPTLFDYQDGRRPNLSANFIKDVEQRLGLAFVPDGAGDLAATVGPEDVFHYIYAVFHSPTYRERYAEFLKIDFPRVPLTSDPGLFAALAAKGAAMVDLHLLRQPGSAGVGGTGGAAVLSKPGDQGITQHGVTTGAVEKVGYHEQQRRVLIASERYFEGIEPEVWAMQIGGYQPLQKWLKDRKGRTLSFDDALHYMRMVVALRETRRLMGEIDGLIPGWPLA
jgi:predicted helicase